MSMIARSGDSETPAWLRALLGIVLIIAGLVVLGDVVVATVISVILIGIALIVGGVFEIIHAFWTKGWGGFIWQIILGVLYVIAGIYLFSQPVTGALTLTWIVAIVLLASGVVRIFVGLQHWSKGGWVLLVSGIFGIIAGLVILSGWPVTGLWVLRIPLGIDLIFSGAGWPIYAFVGKSARA